MNNSIVNKIHREDSTLSINQKLIDESNENDTEIKLDKISINFGTSKQLDVASPPMQLLINEDNTKRLKNTRMCKFILDKGKCPRLKCNFAHTLDELETVSCLFDGNCKFKDNECTYFHEGETFEEYIKKIGYGSLLTRPQEVCGTKDDVELILKNVKNLILSGKKNIRIIIK